MARKSILIWLMIVVLVGGSAAAQDPEPPPRAQNITSAEKWRFRLRPYFYLSGLSGSVTVQSVTIPVNSSFSTLLENVKFGGFVNLTAERGRWGVNADFQYINLYGQSTGLKDTSLDLKNVIGQIDVTFRPVMAPTLRFLAGLRVYSVSQNALIAGRPFPDAKTTVYDPVLGAFGAWPLHPRWDFELMGDIGGFGISSEATYQVMGTLRFGLGENTGIPFGYRIIGYQIKTGGVMMNTRMSGAFLGFDFRF